MSLLELTFGSRAASVAFTSPTSARSIWIRRPMCLALRSICTLFTLFPGRNSEKGKSVPSRRSRSASLIEVHCTVECCGASPSSLFTHEPITSSNGFFPIAGTSASAAGNPTGMRMRDCSNLTTSCLSNPRRRRFFDQSNLWTIGQLMEKPALPNGFSADAPVIKPSCA